MARATANTAAPIEAALPAANDAHARALGGSIRSTRILKGLKLRELGDRIGCSESMLSKIENGRISPSLAMLQRIAQGLQVTIATLFSPVDHARIVSRAGQRATIRIDDAGSRAERLVAPDGGHLLEGHLHVLAPGGGSEGELAHEGEEVGYVITGRLELRLGREAFMLEAGDSFSFRSEIAHSYVNPGPDPAHVVWVSTPGRRDDGPAQRAARRSTAASARAPTRRRKTGA